MRVCVLVRMERMRVVVVSGQRSVIRSVVVVVVGSVGWRDDDDDDDRSVFWMRMRWLAGVGVWLAWLGLAWSWSWSCETTCGRAVRAESAVRCVVTCRPSRPSVSSYDL